MSVRTDMKLETQSQKNKWEKVLQKTAIKGIKNADQINIATSQMITSKLEVNYR